MSLLEALLTEGWRDPREVYIALRADGQKGSGTIDDPYDGSTRWTPPVSVTNLVNSGIEATATTSGNHNYLDGDVVTIAGVTGAGAGAWNGVFVVFAASGNTFKYTLASVPAAGAGGSITSTKAIHRFDDVMRSLTENTAIHIGPGVFETRGFNPQRQSPMDRLNWIIRSGQSISGSGMGATTLKLVFAEPFYATPQLTMAISHNVFSPPDYYPNADNVVVCDLTIDCDMRSQIADRVAKAAMKVSGRHVRIRRVRAVDFGTHFFPTECFVIGTAGADPREQYGLTERVDCRIENCIIEQPSLNGLYTNSCLILFGGEEDASDGSRMGWHRACIIRNNYINNEYLDAPVSIAGITLSGGMATVTTHAPHGRLTGDWVVVSGAQVDGSSANTFNGSYSVTKLNDTQFTYTPAAPVPVTNPGGPMWIGRFSSHWISVQQLQRDPSDATGLTAILTSHTPHQRKPDQWVNVWSGSAPIPAGTEPYYGRFPIVGIISPKVLKYRMTNAPSTLLVQDTACQQGPPACQQDTVFIGSSSVGFTTDGGSEAVAEGNRVFASTIGGSYHDTWGTKDQTDRNNYYSDVVTGPYQFMGSSSPPKLGSLSVVGTTATFTTTKPHGLAVGQGVRISSNIPPPDELFAFYRVATVPTASSFTFDTRGQPVPGNYFGALWQVGLAVRENNVIELGQAHHKETGWGPSSGLPFYSAEHGSEYVFRSVVAKNNLIGLVPGSSNTSARAIEPWNVENAVVEHNLIDLLSATPINTLYSKPLHFFNNQTSSGSLVKSGGGDGGDELRTRIEDALLLAL